MGSVKVTVRSVRSVWARDNHHTVVFHFRKSPTAKWTQARLPREGGGYNSQAHAIDTSLGTVHQSLC